MIDLNWSEYSLVALYVLGGIGSFVCMDMAREEKGRPLVVLLAFLWPLLSVCLAAFWFVPDDEEEDSGSPTAMHGYHAERRGYGE